MRKYLNRFLAFFRSEARTVGLSPKALATFVGAAVTTLLALVGLTPEVLGDAFGVHATVVVGAEVLVAGQIAGWLLGPGAVVQDSRPLVGSDARMGADASARLNREG